MKNNWFEFRLRRSTVVIFWAAVVGIFVVIYFFYPPIINRMRQASYQNTPYVDTPIKP